MTRILLTTILPLVLPAVIYLLWLVMARRRARHAAEGRETLLVRVPWMALLLSGFALSVVSLVVFEATSGTDPWRDHRPPSLQDGAVVPGGVR